VGSVPVRHRIFLFKLDISVAKKQELTYDAPGGDF
jgi:hypothetical protein